MKTLIYFCASMLLSMAVYAQWAPVNRNGGFENATPGTLTGNIPQWSFDGMGARATFIIDNSAGNFVGGVQALRVNLADATGDDWTVQMQHPDLPLDSNKFWRFQMWAKADKPQARASFTINRGAAAGWDEVVRMGHTLLTTSWARYDMAFYSYWGTPDTILSSIHMSLDSNEVYVPITFWFDDLTVIEAVTQSATVVPAGNELILNFGYRLFPGDAPNDVKMTNFAVTAGITDIPITGMALADSLITLTLGENIAAGATVLVSYDGMSALEYDRIPKSFAGVGGVPLVRAFTDPVENRSTHGAVGILNPDFAYNISMWPNPVGESTTLNLEGVAQISRIEIVSITGQIIKSVENNSNLARLDVSGLDKGIYVVVLRSGDRPVRALRFIK